MENEIPEEEKPNVDSQKPPQWLESFCGPMGEIPDDYNP